MENHQFLFIGGLHRSGTSLIHRLIASHPDVSGFHNTGTPQDEGQYLQTVLPHPQEVGTPGTFAFKMYSQLTETSDFAKPQNAQALYDQWSGYWDCSKKFFLEKSPPNIVRTRFFQKMFPNTRFLIITRHPIAVSLATQKWTGHPLTLLFLHWFYTMGVFEKDALSLKDVAILQFEDFLKHPQEKLNSIGHWLGIGDIEVSEEVISDVNSKYLKMWRDQNHSGVNKLYYGGLSSLLESKAKRYGYSFKDIDNYGKIQLNLNAVKVL